MNSLPLIRLIDGVRFNNQRVELTHKALQLFATLAAQVGHMVTMDELIGELWQDGCSSAPSIVHAHVSRLRKLKIVEVRTEKNQHGYSLLVDPNDIDLHVFIATRRRIRHLLGAGDLAQADRLLPFCATLTVGPLFGGLRCGEILSDWKIAYAEHLAAMARDKFELRLRQGRHREVITDLLVACEKRPHDEDLATKLMLALYRCNRRVEVIAAYERLYFTLREELGLDVSRWVQRLHGLVLCDDESLNDLNIQFSL